MASKDEVEKLMKGGGARVSYRVAMEISAPVPGFLLRKITDGLVTLSLPAMFASVEREARQREPG